MGHIIIAGARLLHLLIGALQLLIIFQVVISWTGGRLPYNSLTRAFHSVIKALYRPIQSVIPTVFGGLDITPLLALAGLHLVDRVLIGSLLRLGYELLAG